MSRPLSPTILPPRLSNCSRALATTLDVLEISPARLSINRELKSRSWPATMRPLRLSSRSAFKSVRRSLTSLPPALLSRRATSMSMSPLLERRPALRLSSAAAWTCSDPRRQIRVGRYDLDRAKHLTVLADLGDLHVLGVVAVVTEQFLVLDVLAQASAECVQILQVAQRVTVDTAYPVEFGLRMIADQLQGILDDADNGAVNESAVRKVRREGLFHQRLRPAGA